MIKVISSASIALLLAFANIAPAQALTRHEACMAWADSVYWQAINFRGATEQQAQLERREAYESCMK